MISISISAVVVLSPPDLFCVAERPANDALAGLIGRWLMRPRVKGDGGPSSPPPPVTALLPHEVIQNRGS